MKFIVKRAKNKEWYYILKSRNGKVIIQSETMKRKGSCLKSIVSLQNGVFKAQTFILDK